MSTFAYFPHTEDDIKSMLERIGVSKLDDLYADVPEKFMYRGEYDLPDAMSEQQVRDSTPRTLNLKCSQAQARMTTTHHL